MTLARWTTGAVAVAGALALAAPGCQRPSGRFGVTGNAGEHTFGAPTELAGTQVEGTVRQKSGGELQVSDAAGRQRTVRVDDRTQVVVHGQKSTGLGQIVEGTEVRASFGPQGPAKAAVRVEVVEPPRAPAKGEETKAPPPSTGGRRP